MTDNVLTSYKKYTHKGTVTIDTLKADGKTPIGIID